MARPIAPGIHWIGVCQDAVQPHAHLSAYLISGEKTLLVDAAAPMNGPRLLAELRDLLGPRPLDYLFITHAEVPHMGNADALRAAYPDLTLVSGNPNFIFPAFDNAGRYHKLNPGDRLDLGGRTVEFLAPFLQDLPNTLWLYDPADKALLAADAFAHPHVEGPECPLTADELPRQLQPQDLIGFYQNLFPWLRLMRTEAILAEVDRVFDRDIKVLGPSHGKVTHQPDLFKSLQKETFIELTKC